MNMQSKLLTLLLIAALTACGQESSSPSSESSNQTESKNLSEPNAADDSKPHGLVRNIEEFRQATENLQPGDKIIMANGTWNDVELRLSGVGTEESPIELMAEESGKVIISGESNLRFSGEYIVISGLVFKNGQTPTGEVISFSTADGKLANHSRVTNSVIDNFSTTDRPQSDLWVSIYGKNNRFDRNSLVNKRNRGVTLAVRLNSEGSRKNNHVIEYNYFGPRQILGSNGGETLRIGTSHFSREFSNTTVQYNYLDRTNGEHEIISNKSSGNTIINNVFFETQGTLTMRHGHYTTCLLYTSPSPRDLSTSRMPSSA